MKLLIFYTDKFAFQTNQKGLESAESIKVNESITDAVIGFIHVESKDEQNSNYTETKLVKNLKWAARKNKTNTIVLHSFNHLSKSNASADFSESFLHRVEERLNKSDYITSQTPFGYFLNIEMHAPGTPLARIFKEF